MTQIRALALIVLFLAAGAPLHAQDQATWDPKRVQVTRQHLEGQLAQYEQLLSSGSHSRQYKDRIRAEAELIRRRLREGDVQVGDQVALYVEGNQVLSDTFTVSLGHVLFLPTIGDIKVGGLLRSELEGRLSQELARYIVDPVVRVQPLIRVAVAGEVGSPGFYTVPAETLVSDMLMKAGGPTATANLRKVWVERRGNRVWEGEIMQAALAEGRTLDQMSLHPGDQIYVPRASEKFFKDPWSVTRAVGATAAVIGLLVRVL